MANSKSIVVIGGGISGLASSLILRSSRTAAGFPTNVTLLESSARLGGQIKTERFELTDHTGSVIVEAGAEGFVTRSTIFPHLAELAGLSSAHLVNQQRIADCELAWNSHSNRWDVVELAPGVAAQKLGFQVPKEDRGRGIRSFRNGMSELVENIQHFIPCHTDTEVVGIERHSEGFSVKTGATSGNTAFSADALVLAVPAQVIKSLLSPSGIAINIEQPPHHSHVSVHLLLPVHGTRRIPSSFTVPADKHAHFGGLRACSLVNEKFPGRCDDNHILFRFYFRPESVESVQDKDLWINRAYEALDEIFGIKDKVIWSHFAPWTSTLPSFTPAYLDQCRALKENIDAVFGGRVKLVGAETSGAGLEMAAQSGVTAAKEILNVL